MAENLSHQVQGAWDRAFAKQDQAMGRSPGAAPDEGDPVTKARIADLEGRVTALENPGPAGELCRPAARRA
jgi:hypothetical protein